MPPSMMRHRHGRLRQAGEHLLIAVCCGLTAGLLEAAILHLRILQESVPLFTFSVHYPIAAPLANLAAFAFAGTLIAAPVLIFGCRLPLRWTLSLMLCGCWYVVLHHLNESLMLAVHVSALCLLALALGFRCGAWLARQDDLLPWTSCTCFLLAVICGALFVQNRWAYAPAVASRLPSGEGTDHATRPPDVILIVLDTVRASSLSMYGYDRATTPNLAWLASQGVLFEHAIAPAPWTLPTHAALFTGLRPHETDVGWSSPLSADLPTVATTLRNRGFQTAAFVGNYYYCGRHTGLQRGFQFFDGAPLWSVDLFRHSSLVWNAINSVGTSCGCSDTPGRRTAAEINRAHHRWIQSRATDQPQFTFLNYFDAHDPYLPQGEYRWDYGPQSRNEFQLLRDWGELAYQREIAPDTLQVGRNAYDGCIAELDEELGQLFHALDQSGELDQTVIVVTADHGEHFGEQGSLLHGQTVHRASTHVPLIIAAPGRVPAGKRVRQIVSLCDVPATLMDLAGVEEHNLAGRTLSRFWKEPNSPDTAPGRPCRRTVVTEVSQGLRAPPWHHNSDGPVRSIFVDNVQYIRWSSNGEAIEEAYDFMKDPDEQQNLVEISPHDPRLAACRAQFDRIFRAASSTPQTPLLTGPAP